MGRHHQHLHFQNLQHGCDVARPFRKENGGAHRRPSNARTSLTSSFRPHMMRGFPSYTRPTRWPQKAPPHWLQRNVSGSWPRRSDSSSSSFRESAFMGQLYRTGLSRGPSKTEGCAGATPSEFSPSHGKQGVASLSKSKGCAAATPSATLPSTPSKSERTGACALARSMKWTTGCRSMCASTCAAWAFSYRWSRWRAIYGLGMSGCRLADPFTITAIATVSGGCTRFIGARFTRLCGFAGNGARFSSTTRRRWFAMTRFAPIGCRGTSSRPGSSPQRRRPSCGLSAWGRARGRCGLMRAIAIFASVGTTLGWSYRFRGMRSALPSALSSRGRTTGGRPWTSCRCTFSGTAAGWNHLQLHVLHCCGPWERGPGGAFAFQIFQRKRGVAFPIFTFDVEGWKLGSLFQIRC